MVNWYAVTMSALDGLWQGFADRIWSIIGAILVFVIGWFIAIGIGRLIAEILKRFKLNRLFEKAGWKEALEKAELKVDVAEFIGAIFKWILVIVFLMAAVEILELEQFASFLKDVLAYLPNVIIAALIFVVAVIIADVVEKIVRATVEKIRIGYAQLAGAIVKWAIWIFAILAILMQLNVATTLIQTLFTGLVAVLVISAGLAFGLGGRDVAKSFLEGLQRKIQR